MNTSNIAQTIKNILTGYAGALKRIALFFAVIGIITGISVVIVTPFWYLATNATRIFTIFVLLGLGATAGTALTIRIKRSAEWNRKFGEQKEVKQIIRRIAAIIIKTLCTFAGIYGIIILYISGLTAIAIPATIVLVVVFGYFIYEG